MDGGAKLKTSTMIRQDSTSESPSTEKKGFFSSFFATITRRSSISTSAIDKSSKTNENQANSNLNDSINSTVSSITNYNSEIETPHNISSIENPIGTVLEGSLLSSISTTSATNKNRRFLNFAKKAIKTKKETSLKEKRKNFKSVVDILMSQRACSMSFLNEKKDNKYELKLSSALKVSSSCPADLNLLRDQNELNKIQPKNKNSKLSCSASLKKTLDSLASLESVGLNGDKKANTLDNSSIDSDDDNSPRKFDQKSKNGSKRNPVMFRRYRRLGENCNDAIVSEN